MKQYIITTRFDDVLHCLRFVFAFVWCTCMAINNVSVSYNGGFLPDILLLTQAPIFVWFDGNTEYYIITALLTIYYSVFCFVMFGDYAWRLIQVYRITVDFSRQYNDDPRLLPSIGELG